MLRHAIGWEWGEWEDNISRSGATITTAQKRTGSRSVSLNSNTLDFLSWFKLPLTAGLSEFFYQFPYMYVGSLGGTRPLLKWCKGSNVLGGVKLNSSGNLELWTGNFAAKVATGTQVLTSGRWYVLEIYVKIADSGGLMTLRVDMAEDASFSGDTKPGTDAEVDNLVHGGAQGPTNYFDDLILNDTAGEVNNSWPNGGKVALLRPSADGTLLEWTPNPSGAHYAAVDDDVPSGADYLQATAADRVDELGLQNLPAEALSVKAVILHAWALKGSTIAPTRLALGLKLGGTDYFTGDKDLGTSQGLVREVWNQHPGGGNFTVADVNGASLLLKSRA